VNAAKVGKCSWLRCGCCENVKRQCVRRKRKMRKENPRYWMKKKEHQLTRNRLRTSTHNRRSSSLTNLPRQPFHAANRRLYRTAHTAQEAKQPPLFCLGGAQHTVEHLLARRQANTRQMDRSERGAFQDWRGDSNQIQRKSKPQHSKEQSEATKTKRLGKKFPHAR